MRFGTQVGQICHAFGFSQRCAERQCLIEKAPARPSATHQMEGPDFSADTFCADYFQAMETIS